MPLYLLFHRQFLKTPQLDNVVFAGSQQCSLGRMKNNGSNTIEMTASKRQRWYKDTV